MISDAADAPILTIRCLNADDSAEYRMLRQRILKSADARYFSDSYERERLLTDQEWQDWCVETSAHCILGTFANSELVGIIMITRQGGDESPLVEWEAAWLDPSYRRTGIGKRSYEMARRWSISQGYKFVVGFIRATYTPALNICKDLGFIYAYTVEDELWADGSVADIHAFLLDMRSEGAPKTSNPAFHQFKEVYPYLKNGWHAPPLDESQQEVA